MRTSLIARKWSASPVSIERIKAILLATSAVFGQNSANCTPGSLVMLRSFLRLGVDGGGVVNRRAFLGRLMAAGAALSLVAVHLFGLTDAIALGAKVGLFQWLCAGILIAEWSQRPSPPESRM